MRRVTKKTGGWDKVRKLTWSRFLEQQGAMGECCLGKFSKGSSEGGNIIRHHQMEKKKKGPEGFPSGSVLKNPPDTGNSGLIPGSGNGNPFQYSCLGLPWTEEPGGLQPRGSQRVRHHGSTEHAQVHVAGRGSSLSLTRQIDLGAE